MVGEIYHSFERKRECCGDLFSFFIYLFFFLPLFRYLVLLDLSRSKFYVDE